MFDERLRGVPTQRGRLARAAPLLAAGARLEDLKHGPQRAVLLGEALAVFLTESGKPAVVADRCAHRGASLSMGKVEGDSIQCPYHGWEWAGENGACTRIPSLPDQSQIPPRARIPAFPAASTGASSGRCWRSRWASCPTLPWFDAEEWTWGHGTPFELPVGFGMMIENFRDVAHFAFVHQATLGCDAGGDRATRARDATGSR